MTIKLNSFSSFGFLSLGKFHVNEQNLTRDGFFILTFFFFSKLFTLYFTFGVLEALDSLSSSLI